MNNWIPTLYFALTLIIGCSNHTPSNESITVMSFNIRYDNPKDGENAWGERKQDVVQFLERYTPDFLGIQEGLHHQVLYINDNISYFDFIGKGRDDGKSKGEYTALYFNTKKYKVLKQETFWLSPTPDQVSVGWDASMERICTYGAFTAISSGEIIHVFNAHFDHIGPEARLNSARLILDKIYDLNIENDKIVVMGDFNAEPKSAPIAAFLEVLDDGQIITKNKINGTEGTFNSFDPNKIPNRRIDYIFSKNLKVNSYRHINDKRPNGLCVSDHLPVFAALE